MKSKKFISFLITVIIILCFGAVTVNASAAFTAPKVNISCVESTGKPKLKWKAVKGAKKYAVFCSENGKNGRYKLIANTTNTSYTNNTAVAGKTYYYKVKAITAKGSVLFTPVSIVCDLARPSITDFSNIEATGKIKIKWTPVKGASKYAVYRSSSGKANDFQLIANTTATSFVNKNAVAGKTYYYKIKAIHKNAEAASAFSPAKSHICDLSRPGNITSANIADTGKIRISWDATRGASGYAVYRSATGKDGNYKLIATTTNTSLVNRNAVAGKTYWYKVKAIHKNAEANSTFSSVCRRTCDLPRPANIKISNAPKSGKPIVSWNPVEGASKYAVYRSTTGKRNTFQFLANTYDTSLTNLDAVTGKKYWYKVIAVHSKTSSNSAFSETVNTTAKLKKPVITSIRNNAAGNAVIRWDEVKGAVKYEIHRSTTGKKGSFSLLTSTTATKFVNRDAVAGKTYYYKVKAIHKNAAANSVFSAVENHASLLKTPVITVEKYDTNKAIISWNEQSGAVGYEIYRAVNENGIYRKIFTSRSNYFINGNLCDGAEYFYKVKAISRHKAYNSNFSNTVSYVVGGQRAKFKTMYVSQLLITAFEEPVTDYNTVVIPYMCKVKVGPNISEDSDGCWTQIKYKGKIYYSWSEPGQVKFTDTQSTFDYVKDHHTDIQKQIIEVSLEWLNTPTRYLDNAVPGDRHPETGEYCFDCSSFVKHIIVTVMRRYNPTFFLTTNITDLYYYDTLYNKGFNNQFDVIDVAEEDLDAGDIMFFKLNENDPKVATHCGLYLGNGEYIHCTDTTDGVYIAPLTADRRSKIVGIKRYFPEKARPANQKLRNTELRKVAVFSDTDTNSTQIGEVKANGKVTLLYTNIFETWGYVLTPDGQRGYVLMRYFDPVK